MKIMRSGVILNKWSPKAWMSISKNGYFLLNKELCNPLTTD